MTAKDPTDNDAEPTPLLFSARASLSLVAFFGFINLYAQRVDMSVAVVCMVNHTAVDLLNAETTGNATGGSVAVVSEEDQKCYGDNTTSSTKEDGPFVWDKEKQGMILGSFFYGYICTQVAGGWLATRFGGSRVYGWFMLACAMATLLIPVVAEVDFKFVMAMRVICGITQGVVWPSMQQIWSKWAPLLELTSLGGFGYAGAQVGNVITFPLAGYLCSSSLGWQGVFYVLGGCGVVWFIFWTFLVYDTPEHHPRISEEEKKYILATRGNKSENKSIRIPWLKLFTSPAVLSIYVTHTCANWGTYTFLTNLPSYFNEVLKFDIKSNGMLSALPYVVWWFNITISGFIVDSIRKKKLISNTIIRRSCNAIGCLVPAALVVATGFVDCTSPWTGVALLTVGVGFSGWQYAGFLANPNDIAPRYAGVIFGISNTFATIPGVLAPMAVSYLTENKTQEEWQSVFYVCAGIYTFGALFNLCFTGGSVLEWAVDPAEITEEAERKEETTRV